VSSMVTRAAYAQMIAEDTTWLKTMPRTLEREHILLLLAKAVEYEYGPPPGARCPDCEGCGYGNGGATDCGRCYGSGHIGNARSAPSSEAPVGAVERGEGVRLHSEASPVARPHCDRCDRCGWPFDTRGGAGCWAATDDGKHASCSQRPMPEPRTHCAGCGHPFTTPPAPQGTCHANWCNTNFFVPPTDCNCAPQGTCGTCGHREHVAGVCGDDSDGPAHICLCGACPTCNGTGRRGFDVLRCPTCSGTGRTSAPETKETT
jgi:hypothetical protein